MLTGISMTSTPFRNFDVLEELGQLVLSLPSPSLAAAETKTQLGGSLRQRALGLRTLHCRTVANTLSIGFEVRKGNRRQMCQNTMTPSCRR